MHTVKIVPQQDGTYAVVAKLRGDRADVEIFDTLAEAEARRDRLAQAGFIPLYWSERGKCYMTVPND